MNDKMMKLLMSKKKKGEGLSESEKKSKMEALHGMKDMASSMMSDKLKNLKKVTVASDSSKGLKAGLHKAEDLIGSQNLAQGGEVATMPEGFDTDQANAKSEGESSEQGDSPQEESSESSDEKVQELVDECSSDPSELDKLILKLQEKKKSLES